MKNNVLLMLCVLSTLVCSCNERVTNADRPTIVSGQVINLTPNDPKVIRWNLCDPFNDDKVSAELDSDGRFKLESDGVNLLHNMTLVYDDYINFFTAPGDSIHVVIDIAKMKTDDQGAVIFSGDRADDNNELYHYRNHLSHTMNTILRNKLEMNLPPKAMIAQLNERISIHNDSLSHYEALQKRPMSANLKDFMHREMVFSLANRILDYKPDSANIALELYGDPLFGIHDSLNFCTMMFSYHLSTYINTKMLADSTFKAAGMESNHAELMRSGLRVLMTEPASFSRDVMLWEFLSNMIKYFPQLFESTPAEIQNVFTNAALNNKFATIIEALNKKVEVVDAPLEGVSYLEPNGTLNKLSKADIFKYLAKKHQGKVIYIDVYATWCSPCRIEMKDHAPALHNSMKDKEVVFVNLCLGSGKEKWLNMVKQFNLTENYWFDEDATNLFLGAHKISGYPNYILIGKDGEAATLNANGPSKLSEVTKQIEELL